MFCGYYLNMTSTTQPQKHFFRATKGKVVLGFLFAGLALFMAWGVSKFVFEEILGTVEKISTPNDKLRLVNKLSHQIASLDQLQREPKNNVSFFAATQKLRRTLDTLNTFYDADQEQQKRISKLKQLLKDRDKQFLLYLEVKENLVNTQSFSEEVEKLNTLFSQRTREADSAVFTTETSTSTTTVAPEDEQKSRGFLSRLFGKKKAEVYKIISEEYKVKKDTLNPLVEDSIMRGVENSLKTIETEQRKKSNRFLKKEAELASSSSALTKQMLNVLREVESEVLTQIDSTGEQARAVVSEGVEQIKIIIIVFFVITLILGSLILIDITKNNRYRLALEKAKEEAEYHGRAKQRFLSNMSHEIRTPLQAILGYAEFIANQDQPDKKHVDAIHRSSVHLLQIVNEVLDYNRITSGEFSFKQENFDLQKLSDEVLDAVRPLAEKKGISLLANFDFTEQHCWINGDAFRLKQVLYNLLGNAIKFTMKGYVKLSADCKEAEGLVHCYFTVEDTGIGFSEKDQEKIFKEFEQVANQDHQAINQNGTGLGLAIVKTLVDAQNGRITAKSKPGKGTSFVVYLPYQQVDAPAETMGLAKAKAVDRSKTVWVIDDDKLILELCDLIFSAHQIPYKTFSTAEAILTEPIDDNLSFVLVDMRLEGITGIGLHRKLRAKLPAKVKYYAITAQVLPDEQQAVLDEGFEGVIIKPFKAEDLLSLFSISATEKEVDFDDSSLKKMTMGDQEMMQKILASFKRDCEEDKMLLQQSLVDGNQPQARLVIHRLAGRVAQIGAADLGAAFRQLEQEIAALEMLDETIQARITDLLEQLQSLLKIVSFRIQSFS